MINIVMLKRIHELNALIGSSDDSLPQAQNKYVLFV